MKPFLEWLAKGLSSSIETQSLRTSDFALIRNGRDEFRYVERGRSLNFVAEMMSGDPSMVIYADSIDKWCIGGEFRKVSEQERAHILSNICDYFDRNKFS